MLGGPQRIKYIIGLVDFNNQWEKMKAFTHTKTGNTLGGGV